MVKEVLVLNIYLIFIIQSIIFGIDIYILSKKGLIYLYSFISPSFIALVYFLISFTAGSYTSSRGMGLNPDYIFLPQRMEYIKIISFLILILNFLVFNVYKFQAQKILITKNRFPIHVASTNYIKTFFLIVIHLVLFNIEIDLSFISIAGNFTYPFLFTTSVILFYVISDYKSLVKYMIYLTILTLYTKYNFGSKREILYILILIIYFELIKRPLLRLTIRQAILFLCIGFVAVSIIIVSSIFRGYGSYEVSSFVDIINATTSYVNSDVFKNAFVENFELNTSFCNAFNSFELLFQNKIDYQHGLSFLRIFFLPFPNSIIPWKPERFINIYTEAFNPEFYASGGSLPTTVYGEAFANFHILSLIFIPVIFYFADSIFRYASLRIQERYLNTLAVLSVFSSTTAMQFIRGSGIDLYLIYISFSLPYIMIILWILKLKLKFLSLQKHTSQNIFT